MFLFFKRKHSHIVFILIWNWDDAELKNEDTRSKKDKEESNEKMQSLQEPPHVKPDVIMGLGSGSGPGRGQCFFCLPG